MKQLNFPLFLTLLRLIVSPLVLPILFVYLLPFNLLWLNGILALLFGLLSMTDFFDGYLARKYNQETMLGRVLDPLADKFLTYSVLVALLAAGRIYFYWVVILIGRELFVIGLRYAALEFNISLHVSMLGKIKTVLQMMCITVIIFNPYQQLGMYAARWNVIEVGLLFVTIVFSVVSAQLYYDDAIRSFYAKQNITTATGGDSDQYE